ncbi:hypothetical protein AAG570_000639 [Ranatra chinensis]|uniref:Uncharacterized protein n=1 Tax=Ranatra chinensis TaxID=642074 RepID=A0ABD0YXN7_9HEMI
MWVKYVCVFSLLVAACSGVCLRCPCREEKRSLFEPRKDLEEGSCGRDSSRFYRQTPAGVWRFVPREEPGNSCTCDRQSGQSSLLPSLKSSRSVLHKKVKGLHKPLLPLAGRSPLYLDQGDTLSDLLPSADTAFASSYLGVPASPGSILGYNLLSDPKLRLRKALANYKLLPDLLHVD